MLLMRADVCSFLDTDLQLESTCGSSPQRMCKVLFLGNIVCVVVLASSDKLFLLIVLQSLSRFIATRLISSYSPFPCPFPFPLLSSFLRLFPFRTMSLKLVFRYRLFTFFSCLFLFQVACV